jgi:sarcosine oxidase subunit alpha
MSHRATELAGLPARLFRVSFSGELAFEVHVDSSRALWLWRQLMSAGAEFGITSYGTETMHVLRAEKGYVIVGQDTDGSVTPEDLGLNWLLSGDKDFLGKRSLARPDCRRENRKQWVGILSVDGETVLPEGTQLVERPDHPAPVPMCGHVTSSYRSAFLGHPIALGLIEGGRSRRGETLFAAVPGRKALPVTVASPVFYDPSGERQKDGGDV